jgi:hypothetical protein
MSSDKKVSIIGVGRLGLCTALVLEKSGSFLLLSLLASRDPREAQSSVACESRRFCCLVPRFDAPL